jgi:hypothetical protein
VAATVHTATGDTEAFIYILGALLRPSHRSHAQQA